MSRARETSGGMFWFECSCQHRWSGHSQKAKDLAWRLHGTTCDRASGKRLANLVLVDKMNKAIEPQAQTVQRCIDELRAGHVQRHL